MKKIKLLIIILLILTILILIIGLTLIDISYMYIDIIFKSNLIKIKGFDLLKFFGVGYILDHSANFLLLKNNYYGNYYNWIQLQIGIIFSIILVPLLLYIIILLIFSNIFLKLKNKNNFWDSIENCEVINDYYIH